MPNAWTFEMKPIQELLSRYVGDGQGWIDPFAGKNSPAEITNDINPNMPTDYHSEAVDFVKQLKGTYSGILFDPPYSYRQVKEHYESIGKKATAKDTTANFYRKVMTAVIPKLRNGALAISFGWNSNGFGKTNGFEMLEVMLIHHGGHNNDTIVTVERKLARLL